MNEPRFILEQQLKFGNMNKRAEEEGLPIEANQYEDLQISNYESEHGVPYIVDKLQIRNEYIFDSQVRVKSRSIEEFILNKMTEEETRTGKVSYETILDRILRRLPDSLEQMILSKNNLKALEMLFQEIAIVDGLSGESYLKVVSDKLKIKRIHNLLSQIKELTKVAA